MAVKNKSVDQILRETQKKKSQKPGKKLPKRCSKVHSNHYKKYERYRQRVGRPLGPGVAGNKAGKNRVKRSQD